MPDQTTVNARTASAGLAQWKGTARYEVLSCLGRGGMGIVYKVEHTRIGKLLAMKLLTGELSRNPDVVRRFARARR